MTRSYFSGLKPPTNIDACEFLYCNCLHGTMSLKKQSLQNPGLNITLFEQCIARIVTHYQNKQKHCKLNILKIRK